MDTPKNTIEPLLRIPKFLYGDNPTVIRRTKAFLKKLTKDLENSAAIFAEVTREENSVHIDEIEEILISTPSRGIPKGSIVIWRTHGIKEFLGMWFWEELHYHAENKLLFVQQHDSLILNGLNQFWFTLGMLNPNGSFIGVCNGHRGYYETPQDFPKQIFSKLEYWLPVLARYQSKYRSGLERIGHPPRWYFDVEKVLCMMGWADQLQEYNKRLQEANGGIMIHNFAYLKHFLEINKISANLDVS